MPAIDKAKDATKASVGSHCQTKLDQFLKGKSAKSAHPAIFMVLLLVSLKCCFLDYFSCFSWPFGRISFKWTHHDMQEQLKCFIFKGLFYSHILSAALIQCNIVLRPVRECFLHFGTSSWLHVPVKGCKM